MSKKINLILIGSTLALYCINNIFKVHIALQPLKWFMSCYFNDAIGGITFIAYCNLIFSFSNRETFKLWIIETILLSSGLFWEYVTPVFRTDTVTDMWDIVAYLMGGFIYWIIVKKYIKGLL